MSKGNAYLNYTTAQLDEAIGKVLSGELDVPLQEKSVTPTLENQTVLPDSAYKGLSKVTVDAIPQSYLDEQYDMGHDAGYTEGYTAGSATGIKALITNDTSITPTGTYATSTYYNTSYGVKVGYMRNGDIIVSMQAGTTTSYEALYMNLASAPSGVTITTAYNTNSSYSTGSPALIYACIISGLKSNATMSIAMTTRNGSYDYTRCDITLTAV